MTTQELLLKIRELKTYSFNEDLKKVVEDNKNYQFVSSWELFDLLNEFEYVNSIKHK